MYLNCINCQLNEVPYPDEFCVSCSISEHFLEYGPGRYILLASWRVALVHNTPTLYVGKVIDTYRIG
ncbi:hypothetical protein F4694_005255 [Bacillus niacini]|uniref:Uncharacterized protein n=1 Tax=Neobacillus niacini TaxID=86668 RepID=A0A852TJQ2_9BACI|nr:hypothetical protein [Neobacillus niacini]